MRRSLCQDIESDYVIPWTSDRKLSCRLLGTQRPFHTNSTLGRRQQNLNWPDRLLHVALTAEYRLKNHVHPTIFFDAAPVPAMGFP